MIHFLKRGPRGLFSGANWLLVSGRVNYPTYQYFLNIFTNQMFFFQVLHVLFLLVSGRVYIYIYIWMFPKIGGTPPKWMVKIMENPMNKWMIWGVFPLFLVQHPYIGIIISHCENDTMKICTKIPLKVS